RQLLAGAGGGKPSHSFDRTLRNLSFHTFCGVAMHALVRVEISPQREVVLTSADGPRLSVTLRKCCKQGTFVFAVRRAQIAPNCAPSEAWELIRDSPAGLSNQTRGRSRPAFWKSVLGNGRLHIRRRRDRRPRQRRAQQAPGR